VLDPRAEPGGAKHSAQMGVVSPVAVAPALEAFSRVHEPDDLIGVSLGNADGAWGDRLSAHLPRSRFVPDDLEPGGVLGGWNVPSAPLKDFSVG
jgi:hypothetical protein